MEENKDILEEDEKLETEAEEIAELDKESETVDFSTIEEEDVSTETIISIANANDTIRVWLKEIGSIPLLTSEQEYDYSMYVMDGIKAKKELEVIENNDLNTVAIEQYNELLDRVEKGNFYREKLINANLRLVVAIAKKYVPQGIVPFEDLIQEGNMGLMRAVEKYDCTKGFKFSTYATWWIRQSITRALADQGRTIRIPVHMVESVNKVKKVQRELTTELGREPTNQEISERVGMSVEKISKIFLISQNPISLEQKVGDDEESTLGDFVADESQLTPYQYTERQHLHNDIMDLLETVLTDRERQVIEARFGLNGYETMTLEEVALHFTPKVTRERIRQIEAKAIRKLMRNPKAKLLKAYLGR